MLGSLLHRELRGINYRVQDKGNTSLFYFYRGDTFGENWLESLEFQEDPFGVSRDTLLSGSCVIRRLVGFIVGTIATTFPHRDFMLGFAEQVALGPTQLVIWD